MWSYRDALSLFITKKNLRFWDKLNIYNIIYDSSVNGLKAFIEIGLPTTHLRGNNKKVYYDHGIGTNIGVRKYGILGNKNFLMGFELLRLVQGSTYDILPTPNWYDNINYDYSSYKGRRWSAHAGSDSDDILLYLGYDNQNITFIYGVNYERHGVGITFPRS